MSMLLRLIELGEWKFSTFSFWYLMRVAEAWLLKWDVSDVRIVNLTMQLLHIELLLQIVYLKEVSGLLRKREALYIFRFFTMLYFFVFIFLKDKILRWVNFIIRNLLWKFQILLIIKVNWLFRCIFICLLLNLAFFNSLMSLRNDLYFILTINTWHFLLVGSNPYTSSHRFVFDSLFGRVQ